MGTSSINGPFSMAMLNNQRVYIYIYIWLVVSKMFLFHTFGIIIPSD